MKDVDIIKCLNSLFVKAYKERTFEEENAFNEAKNKIRGYPAEIARLTAINQRLREEAEEQKSIAAHEHATQMEWFSIAGDYKAENAELREKLDKAQKRVAVLEGDLYLLKKRLEVMREYCDILGVRLSLWNNEQND